MSAIRTTIAAPARRLVRAAPRRFQSTSTSSASASSASTSSASTTATDAAAKARQAAADVSSKAAEGLSRVSAAAGPAIAAAGPAISNAARGLTTALGRVGGRTGKVINFVEAQTPFVVYYSKVGIELSRLVFRAQKMAPPPLATFQAAFETAFKQLQNPASLFQQAGQLVKSARALSPAQLATGGVLAAELLGFFTVGEIIGRFKLVGYHGHSPAAAAHH